MKIMFINQLSYQKWNDYDFDISIKILPNISIEIFNDNFNFDFNTKKLIWSIKIVWLIFSIIFYIDK